MRKASLYFFLSALATILSSRIALSATVNLGYVSFDVGTIGPGTGAIDVFNQAGLNSNPFPATDFPVTTPVTFTIESLLISYNNGPSQTFGPSYFTMNSDGSLSGSGLPSPTNVTSATLMGILSATALVLNDGSTLNVRPTFTTTISNSPVLRDGNFQFLIAETADVPEPSSVILTIAGLGALLLISRRRNSRSLWGGIGVLTLGIACVPVNSFADDVTVQLNGTTVPGSGVAGVSIVNISGSGFPAGVTAAEITVTIQTACGAMLGSTTTTATAVTPVLGSTDKISFLLPASLDKGLYYAQVSGTAGGVGFTSSDCSAVQVTNSNVTLAACNPGSSMGVLSGIKATGSADVIAYVPNGYWSSAAKGIRIVPVEGAGSSPAVITTGSTVNSCSSNSATGETVCTANDRNIYLVMGNAITNTLTSASNTTAGFSGGSCQNCGVAVNSLTNQAVITIGYSPAASRSALQFIDLNTNTLSAPVPTRNEVSEDILWDPFKNLILSPNERNNYGLFQINGSGLPDPTTVIEFSNVYSPRGGEYDSAAEDCTTGIALSSAEGTGNLYIGDLTQATFNSAALTWTGPQQVQIFPEFNGLSAGTDGIAIAPGNTHLGVVAGEFGGNTIGVIQLPATSGSGTPSVVDYVYLSLPNSPDGFPFSNGFDPHTTTAYTSPNTGKAYGLLADWATSVPKYLTVVDLAAALAAPRTSGTHTISPSYNLLTNDVVRYVATQ